MILTLLQSYPDYYSATETSYMAFGTGTIIFAIVLYLFTAYCLYKIFVKAGVENPWGAFIPIYNYYLLTQAVKVKWWWTILCLIPYVNFIVIIYLFYRLAKFFDKEWYYVILIFFLIGYIILAFGDAKYNPTALPDER